MIPSPGVYVLTCDVVNPTPDRRSKDWINQPVFPKGLRLVVRPYAYFDFETKHRSYPGPVKISKYQGYGSMFLLVRPEDVEVSGDGPKAKPGKWHALCKALAPEVGPERCFSGIGGNPDPENAYAILCKLIQREVVTEAEIAYAYQEINAEYDAEEGRQVMAERKVVLRETDVETLLLQRQTQTAAATYRAVLESLQDRAALDLICTRYDGRNDWTFCTERYPGTVTAELCASLSHNPGQIQLACRLL